MRIRVQLYAACRELLGTPELELELAPGASVATVLERLIEREPRFARFAAGLRYARNEQFVPVAEPLADGDELVLIPPVSGGSA